jgi:hypothetical protein
MTRLLLLLALMAAPAAVAQPTLDMRALDALFDRPPRVEVNLNGSLLRMASTVAGDEDPDTAEMIRGLRGIQVRVYPLDAARGELSDSIADYVRQFYASGWQTMVRVRPDDDDPDDVTILVRALEDGFDGMVVMALDEEDGSASFVLIEGPVDLSQLNRLSDRFAGTDLAPAPPAPPAPPRAPRAPRPPEAPEAPGPHPLKKPGTH